MTKFSAPQQSQLAQIGAYLRENREKQGKSLEDIAISTYIRPQLLSGIETGDPDMLPEPIFVQGFIRRYAETLGLQGIEISQQFTVTSIPSTPRPARRTEEPKSSTTRFTTKQTTTTVQPAADSAAVATGGPLFNAGNLSPLGEPFPNGSPEEESTTQPAEMPLIMDDAVRDLSVTTSNEVSDAVPAPSVVDSASIDAISEDSVSGDAISEEVIVPPSLDKSVLIEEPAPEVSDAVPTEVPTEIPTEIPTDLPTASFTETPSPEPTSEVPPLNMETPVFTTQVTTTEPGVMDRSPYSTEPIGVEIERQGPNLKPFAIGAIVVAAIAAGIMLIVNAIGGDRTSIVAGDTGPDVEQLEDPVAVEPDLPPVPDPTPTAAPVNTAPVSVEASANAEAWVSVIADGNEIFVGTLQAGDTQIWEAEETLSIYSGDGGALDLAADGSAAEAMGERGFPEEKIFTAQ
ncbi:MAG: RodZ domain-containing protein [Cyanobacteria bacterium P01_D01_bin.36]